MSAIVGADEAPGGDCLLQIGRELRGNKEAPQRRAVRGLQDLAGATVYFFGDGLGAGDG